MTENDPSRTSAPRPAAQCTSWPGHKKFERLIEALDVLDHGSTQDTFDECGGAWWFVYDTLAAGVTLGPHEYWGRKRERSWQIGPGEDHQVYRALRMIVAGHLRAAYWSDEAAGRHEPGKRPHTWWAIFASHDADHPVPTWETWPDGTRHQNGHTPYSKKGFKLPNLAPRRCWPGGSPDFMAIADWWVWRHLDGELFDWSRKTGRHHTDGRRRPKFDLHWQPVPSRSYPNKKDRWLCDHTSFLVADDTPSARSPDWPAGIAKPTISTQTTFATQTIPDKYQAVWALQEPAPRQEATEAQWRAVQQLNADKRAKAYGHTVRVPGAWSAKRQRFTELEVLNLSTLFELGVEPTQGGGEQPTERQSEEEGQTTPRQQHSSVWLFVATPYVNTAQLERGVALGGGPHPAVGVKRPGVGVKRRSGGSKAFSQRLEERLRDGYGSTDRSLETTKFVDACVRAGLQDQVVWERLLDEDQSPVAAKIHDCLHKQGEAAAWTYFRSLWDSGVALVASTPATGPDDTLNELYIARITPALRRLEDRATAEFVEKVMERARRCCRWTLDATGLHVTFEATQAQIAELLGESRTNVGRKLRTDAAIGRYVTSLRDGHVGKGSSFVLSFPPAVCSEAGIELPSPARQEPKPLAASAPKDTDILREALAAAGLNTEGLDDDDDDNDHDGRTSTSRL